jgi:hypothetical protein
VFLSPGLEAAAGYASNRFLDGEEEGSAYHRLVPRLELTAFAPAGTEVHLMGIYSLTDYSRSGFEEIEETRGEAAVSTSLGNLTGTLAATVGRYTDGALPDDDSRWVSLEPSVAWAAGQTVTLSLSGAVTATRYDSRDTSDEGNQRDTRWEIRPAGYWMPTSALQVWGEGYGEHNRSNEAREEYSGFGGALGLDAFPLERARVGAWVRYGVRNYRSDEGSDRRDTPLSAGLWTAVRLAPWAELTASATWADYQSTDPASEYGAWTGEFGLRFVYDWEATSR